MARRRSRSGKQPRLGRLRIVAGKWRSRLLQIGDDPQLRPTSERVRETLFNWLAPSVEGASCLDLFAGTGALGLEALSRGAGRVVFVERSRESAALLQRNIASLEAENADVMTADSMTLLANSEVDEFDIVFVDPPFAEDLYGELCRLLEEHRWLAPSARIYLEQPSDARYPPVPQSWELLKEQTAGKVRYFLFGNGQPALNNTDKER